MEVIFLLVLPAALWAHSWHLLGLYSNTRTMGLIAVAVALILGGLIVFQPATVLADVGGGGAAQAAITVLVAAWVVYAVILAGVTLWGFDERTLGFYALFLWVISLIYVGYYFLGPELFANGGGASAVSWVMGTAVLLLSVLAGLLFFYLGPPFARMRTATGWFFLVITILVTLLGGLTVLGLPLN